MFESCIAISKNIDPSKINSPKNYFFDINFCMEYIKLYFLEEFINCRGINFSYNLAKFCTSQNKHLYQVKSCEDFFP